LKNRDETQYWKDLYEAEREYNKELQKEIDAIDEFNIYTAEAQLSKLKLLTH